MREGEEGGLSCGANAVLTDIVKRVERNEPRIRDTSLSYG